MFAKRLKELTLEDIAAIIGVQESDQAEFKEALSAKDGVDGWHTGADRVGDRARNQIISEIIAFANAHGGTLLLGIEETDDNPRRAKGNKPIPRCADLAERVSMFCRDMIDPQIPIIEISHVAIDGHAGVVAVRVPRSRSGPHRCKASLECWVRRADRTERMTMREIQDLTLQLDRGLASIERRFQDRAEAISRWRRPDALILRATGIPLAPIEIPDIPGDERAYPVLSRFSGRFTNGATTVAQFPAHIGRWRPILRGARCASEDSHGCHIEVQRDGLVEFVFAVEADERLKIYATWFMGLACNALRAIESARRAAAAPAVEYGLDLAIHVRHRALPVGGYGDHPFREGWGPIEPPGCVLPRYSVGDRTSLETLLDLIQRDFWNAAGHNLSDEELLKVDF